MRENFGGRGALKSRGKGTRREALLEDRVVPGVETLDRGLAQSPREEAHIP